MTKNNELPDNRYSVNEEMTLAEFQAMAKELRAFSDAHPINILARMQSSLGPPLAHRRDFRYQGQEVRVLLTRDVLDFPSRPMHATHLSVVSLAGRPIAPALTEEILAAFFPGVPNAGPKSILEAGLEPGELLTMPSALAGVTQYTVLVPAGASNVGPGGCKQ